MYVWMYYYSTLSLSLFFPSNFFFLSLVFRLLAGVVLYHRHAILNSISSNTQHIEQKEEEEKKNFPKQSTRAAAELRAVGCRLFRCKKEPGEQLAGKKNKKTLISFGARTSVGIVNETKYH